MHILAGRIGQIINLHSVAGDLGISGATLQEWLSVLEASYIVFRLKPLLRAICVVYDDFTSCQRNCPYN
ncbi:MAG: DUF4143 domain-containing protein [Bacillota bacterium]